MPPAASKPPSPPNDITGLLPAPVDPLPIALAALACIAAGIGLYFFLKSRKDKPEVARKPKVKSVRDQVADMILQLEKMTPLTPFEVREREEFFFQLSVMLRSFLELKSGMPLTDMTTLEISRTWESLGVDMNPDDKRQALEFLVQADRIKFAKEDIGVVQAERFRDTIVGWLRTMDGRMMR